MATTAGIGISRDQDSLQAGSEAAALSLKNSGGKVAKALLVFASTHFDQQQVIDGVRKIAGNIPLAGSSVQAAITRAGVLERSVVVMAVFSDVLSFSSTCSESDRVSAQEAAENAAKKIVNNIATAPRLFLMFADILAADGAELARGVANIFGPHVPIFGAASADAFAFEKTYQYSDAKALSGAIAGLGIQGGVTIGIGVEHGWVPIGLPMKVTKAAGTLLLELDGRPAVAIYQEYFGESAANTEGRLALTETALVYPLGVKVPDSERDYITRNILSVNTEGGIILTAGIPEGSEVRLMISSKDQAMAAAKNAARRAMQELITDGTTPRCALICSCISRLRLFGKDAAEEIAAIAEILGPNVPIAGFYSYGTWAPRGGEIRIAKNIVSYFYNQAVAVLVIGE